jgi:hypothetical protein
VPPQNCSLQISREITPLGLRARKKGQENPNYTLMKKSCVKEFGRNFVLWGKYGLLEVGEFNFVSYILHIGLIHKLI